MRKSVNFKTKKLLTHDELLECREAFSLFDRDQVISSFSIFFFQSGVIDSRELKAAMTALGFDTSGEELKEILRTVLLKSPEDHINFEEFCELMNIKFGETSSREEIAKVFRLFDTDGTGSISFKNLKNVCLELNERLTDEEIQGLISECDRSGDGCISFDEFFRVMQRHQNPIDEFDSD